MHSIYANTSQYIVQTIRYMVNSIGFQLKHFNAIVAEHRFSCINAHAIWSKLIKTTEMIWNDNKSFRHDNEMLHRNEIL